MHFGKIVVSESGLSEKHMEITLLSRTWRTQNTRTKILGGRARRCGVSPYSFQMDAAVDVISAHCDHSVPASPILLMQHCERQACTEQLGYPRSDYMKYR
ncbi:hypothetical protein C8Q80DRAFT_48773 [Daedaleopsis nitida]|nr:hypothetical protein C8Q80DRAFT_48773 [Daedaleopsis nitida]